MGGGDLTPPGKRPQMEVELGHTPHILRLPSEDEESDKGDDTGRKAGKTRNIVMKFNVVASPP